MIEHAFTLHTDMFEATTPSSALINPRCFGEDFATWVRERLQARGWTPSAPIAEDWGWAFAIPHLGRTYTLSIGIMDESIGCTPAEWRIGIAFETPVNSVRSWFVPAPTRELRALADVLEGLLRAEPRIQQVTPE